MLVLHDTTEFTFKREKPELIGSTCIVNGKDKKGRITFLTVCGILMHSSLVVTTDGLPLGLAAIKFWSRKKFKGSNALKKKINPTRVSIEVGEPPDRRPGEHRFDRRCPACDAGAVIKSGPSGTAILWLC